MALSGRKSHKERERLNFFASLVVRKRLRRRPNATRQRLKVDCLRIGRWMLDPFDFAPLRSGQAVERWTLFSLPPKKVPPPTPDGREGRLFPPEQSWKTALLVTELGFGRNKILRGT